MAGYLVDDGFDLGIRLQRSICSLLVPKTLAAPCRKVAQTVFDCEVITKGTPNEHVGQRQLAANGVPCLVFLTVSVTDGIFQRDEW